MNIAKLTAEQAIIVTGCTGLMCCDLDEFLADLNARVQPAVPFVALDLASERIFNDIIKPAYLPLLMPLLPVDWDKESKRAENAERAELAQLAEAQRPKLVLAK